MPENKAQIVFAFNNFWGRSIAAVSASSDPDSYGGFGPYVPNFFQIAFDNLEEVEVILIKKLNNILESHISSKYSRFYD